MLELSREPFVAALQIVASIEQKKTAAFNNLDFNALIIDKHLHTRASLLAYVQDYGSPGAKPFTALRQRKLQEPQTPHGS